jgi:hypothetical protein
MKFPSLLALAATAFGFAPFASAEDVTIYYPNQDKPVFSITAPEGWEFEPGDKDDPYCTLTKGDTVLYFKTVEGTEEKLGEAIKETYEYVHEEYPKAELPDAKETKIDGKEALAASGEGKDKEGTLTHFGFAWVFVGKGQIAELWYESSDKNEKNAKEAINILKSFKAK